MEEWEHMAGDTYQGVGDPGAQITHSFGDDCQPPHVYSEAVAMPPPNPVVRTFASGANRNSDIGKWDYEGFLSPMVLARFAEYMHKNRFLANGELRDSDNWQKGIPNKELVKSGLRHCIDWWLIDRVGYSYRPEEDEAVDLQEALCGLMFNTMARLHNELMGLEE